MQYHPLKMFKSNLLLSMYCNALKKLKVGRGGGLRFYRHFELLMFVILKKSTPTPTPGSDASEITHSFYIILQWWVMKIFASGRLTQENRLHLSIVSDIIVYFWHIDTCLILKDIFMAVINELRSKLKKKLDLIMNQNKKK